MRSAAAVGGAVVALALAAVALAASAQAASKRPTLQFIDLDPVTVRGLNFKSGERVKVLVSTGRVKRLATKANANGTFSLSLGIKVDGCTAVVVQAFGNRGSRAMIDITAPDCAKVDRAGID
jgi:hypothetical protein